MLVLGNPVVEAVGVSLVVAEGVAEVASDLRELRIELTAEDALAALHNMLAVTI